MTNFKIRICSKGLATKASHWLLLVFIANAFQCDALTAQCCPCYSTPAFRNAGIPQAQYFPPKQFYSAPLMQNQTIVYHQPVNPSIVFYSEPSNIVYSFPVPTVVDQPSQAQIEFNYRSTYLPEEILGHSVVQPDNSFQPLISGEWIVPNSIMLVATEPDQQKCKKSIKVLKECIRLCGKYNVNLSESRKKELTKKIQNKTITMSDVPSKVRKGESFPENEAPYNSDSLGELETWCRG